MVKKLTQEQLKKIGFWVLGIALLIRFINPEGAIELSTASVFGGFGGITVGFGVLMLLIGIGLLFIPGGGIVVGPLFVGAALLIGGGALLSQLTELLSSFSGIAIVGIIILVIFLIFKRR